MSRPEVPEESPRACSVLFLPNNESINSTNTLGNRLRHQGPRVHMNIRPLFCDRAVYYPLHVCRLIYVANMAKGKRNSQKRKKSFKGTDDGENDNDDEGKYNKDTVVVLLGSLFS